jgi:hypothetical protein
MCKKRLAMRELCLTQVGHCLYNKYHDEDLDMDCKGWCLLFTQAIVRFCLYNCCMTDTGRSNAPLERQSARRKNGEY